MLSRHDNVKNQANRTPDEYMTEEARLQQETEAERPKNTPEVEDTIGKSTTQKSSGKIRKPDNPNF